MLLLLSVVVSYVPPDPTQASESESRELEPTLGMRPCGVHSSPSRTGRVSLSVRLPGHVTTADAVMGVLERCDASNEIWTEMEAAFGVGPSHTEDR